MSGQTGTQDLSQRVADLERQNQELATRLEEAEQTIEAIRQGQVDALVVNTPAGERIFTLEGADRPYRTLIEQMREGAGTLDRQGAIHYCNRALAELLKRPLEAAMGSRLEQHVNEPDRPALAALLEQGASGAAHGEVRLCAADGSLVPVHIGLTLLTEDAPAPICMVVTDLTARKRAEKVLASEQFIRRLIDHASIGVAVVGPDMRYMLVNPSYRAIAGGAPMVGRSIDEVFPREVARIVEPAVRQVFQSGQPAAFSEREAPVRGRSWWDVTEIPLHDPAGAVEAVLILTQDVTDRKRHEEELKAAKVCAEQAKVNAESANQAKDQFIAVLSHELRTPLTPAAAALALLRTDARLPADVREDLVMVSRNLDLEIRLIADLLDVSRIISGKLHLEKRPADVAAAIREAAGIVSGDLDAKGQKLIVQTPGEPYAIFGDAARLQQVFWNLLRNAIKFSPERSTIEVRARVEGGRRPAGSSGAAGPSPAGSDAPPPVLAIDVIDHGSGIAPEMLPRLFGAFAQDESARSFGGLGLGLSICKAVVEAHGGTIFARSDGAGRGATFTVRLPVAVHCPPPTPGARAAGASRPHSAARPMRVLVVEDHADTAKLMRRLLTADGHEVVIAGCVAEGLAAVEQGRPDILISDVGLPDGSGLDLMRRLLAQGHRIPAIALSGYGSTSDIEKSMAAGFREHLVKPLSSLDVLTNAIARLGV